MYTYTFECSKCGRLTATGCDRHYATQHRILVVRPDYRYQAGVPSSAPAAETTTA